MFWIALSAFIMTLTGEGDDTFVIRRFLERAREAVSEHVHDPLRQKQALETLARTSKAFAQHRKRTGQVSACIEQVDRKYAASAADYERCLADVAPAWDAAAEALITLSHEFRRVLTPAELAAVRRDAEP
ncbi:MAG TPA: hypothetical protein VJV79_20990 [Polyangiaceae bacterium]|nr:hypothetical protein [Polyangiaceae bacterium]